MLLLTVIYIAFIGLGVPDSLIGSAWPAIYTDWNLPVSAVSCITLLISGCTVLSSVFSTNAINRFGTHRVSAVSTAVTALALLGFATAPNFILMCIYAIPLGAGAGAIDAALNNYIALHYKAHHMNFLHCFYGIGVSCSPYLMSLALSGNSWRNGYLYAFILQSIIALILIFSFGLWKKDSSAQEEEKSKTLSVAEMFRMPKLRIAWIIMLATNAIEYVCGSWGSLYLVETKGLSPEHGALALTLYYAGMALGRFMSGIISGRLHTWKRIYIGNTILFAAIVMLLVPNSTVMSVAGLFAVGFGNGSIYPNFIHLTPYNFGKDISQAVMGSQIATAYIGVMIAPPLFGAVNHIFNIQSLPAFIGVLYVIMIASIYIFTKHIKAENKYNRDV